MTKVTAREDTRMRWVTSALRCRQSAVTGWHGDRPSGLRPLKMRNRGILLKSQKGHLLSTEKRLAYT